jgi:hypothetical protein
MKTDKSISQPVPWNGRDFDYFQSRFRIDSDRYVKPAEALDDRLHLH